METRLVKLDEVGGVKTRALWPWKKMREGAVGGMGQQVIDRTTNIVEQA